jgi:selenocysteine lyase/cysteine desulfurase
VVVDYRHGAIRFSVGVYNSMEQIERFGMLLRKVMEDNDEN